MNLETLKQNRKTILTIAAKHGAFNVRIFGSVARNQANAYSDVDLLIDYNLDKTSPWFPVQLIRELEELLQTKVDIVTATGLKQRIREQVLQEAIPL